MSQKNHFLQRKSDNNNHRNMFSNKKMVSKFNYHENEFPDLAVADKEKKGVEEGNKDKEAEALNFKDAALKESPEQPIKHYILPDGWIGYYYDCNRQIVKIDNSIQKTEEEEFEEEQIICNKLLLQNLLQYQIAYDEVHGEGEYDRVYSMKEDFYMEEE